MKLACVVQRYGREVVGGSESHCRALAERLAGFHDVTVLTSCSMDAQVWANRYPAGRSEEAGVRVHRFPVGRPRNLQRMAELNHIVSTGDASLEQEDAWFRENGPEVPGLLEHLRSEGASYDRVLFWTYRYAPSFFGLPLVQDRAVLIPTAEEDSIIRLRSLADYFPRPLGYLFLTPEERELIARRLPKGLPPSSVIGTGLEPVTEPADTTILRSLGLTVPFVLYLGRVEVSKGCDSLLRYFERFVEREGDRARLVLAGPVSMHVPEHPSIVRLGFVEDRVRAALLDAARVLVVPSPYESLSIALLEAWNQGLPALVNGGCRVLKGQVTRANGGLYYGHVNEFVAGLRELLDRQDVALALGRQGLDYVERHYRWPLVMDKVQTFLNEVSSLKS